MHPKLLGSLSLLLLGPAVGFAQSAPRVYAGASATLIYAAPFSSYSSSRFGPAATLGVQLSPSWAAETGFQLFWQKRSLSSTDLSLETNNTTFVIPLLARYTFTDAASPLQVDALGGGSWLHSSFRSRYTYFNNSSQPTVENYRGTRDAAALTLGPQVRYQLGSNFEAKLSLPFNFLANGGGSASDRLFLSPQLGAQYTFGN